MGVDVGSSVGTGVGAALEPSSAASSVAVSVASSDGAGTVTTTTFWIGESGVCDGNRLSARSGAPGRTADTVCRDDADASDVKGPICPAAASPVTAPTSAIRMAVART
jgi:hypothetical protein